MPEPLRSTVFEQLALEDTAAQVRGVAWGALPQILREAESNEPYLQAYYRALREEQEPLSLRLLLETAPELVAQLEGESLDACYRDCRQWISALHTEHADTRVRRWAAQARVSWSTR